MHGHKMQIQRIPQVNPVAGGEQHDQRNNQYDADNADINAPDKILVAVDVRKYIAGPKPDKERKNGIGLAEPQVVPSFLTRRNVQGKHVIIVHIWPLAEAKPIARQRYGANLLPANFK